MDEGMTRDRITLYFDGGCQPNPGMMETAVVVCGQSFFRDDLGMGDNNEAEWLALLHAVELAIAMQATDVQLIGDSTVVIEQARGKWRCRSAQLKPYYAAYVAAASQIPRITLKHVARSKNLAGIALARRRFG